MGSNVLLHIVVGVENDLDNAVLVHPFDEILAQAGILLTRSAQQSESIILFVTAGPCGIGTGQHTLAAADAAPCVPLGTEVHWCQSFYRLLFAGFYAGSATDATIRFQMRHCHTHNTKVVHPNLGTVVGTAGQSNLKMQIIGEHRFLNALGKGCGIIASIGTDTVAHAGGDISSTGGG